MKIRILNSGSDLTETKFSHPESAQETEKGVSKPTLPTQLFIWRTFFIN